MTLTQDSVQHSQFLQPYVLTRTEWGQGCSPWVRIVPALYLSLTVRAWWATSCVAGITATRLTQPPEHRRVLRENEGLLARSTLGE
jgi:hypothetical protein